MLISLPHYHIAICLLLSNADDTAGDAASCITGLERLFVTALAQIVLFLVDDDRSADDRMLADQRHEVISHVDLDLSAIGFNFNITQVTDMAILVALSAVSLAERVEVRTGRLATIAQIAELVDVEAVLTGLEASNLTTNGGVATLGILLESDNTRNT